MKKLSTGGFKSFVKEFFSRFMEHDIAQIGGQIAYFTILSVFPFLVYINELIASVNLSRNDVAELLSPFVSAEILQFAISYTESLQETSGAGLMSLSILITLYSASRVLRSMESAVNRAYNTPKRRGYIKSVIYSMIFTVCMGLAFILAILLAVAGDKVLGIIFAMFDMPKDHIGMVILIKWVVALLLVCGLIAVVYYILPNTKIKFKSTLPGAVFSTAGLGVLSAGFEIYTKYFIHFSVIYGSIGTVFVVLVWAYFAGTILVSGAEINCILHEYNKKPDKKDD